MGHRKEKDRGERKMKVVDLKTQNLSNPIGIQTEKPVLSWKLISEEVGQKQTAYRIVAASTKEKLICGEYDIWDSGKIAGSDNYGIVYGGVPLNSMERVYWRTIVWDRNGNETSFSDSAYWEMGLLSESDWKGKWITAGEAPILSKEFSVQKGKEIVSGRLYITGLGLFEAHFNGVTLGNGTYFNPGESDVRDTVYYCTYDITDYLNADEDNGWNNAISFLLGNGQYANYRIHQQSGRYYKTDDWRSEAEIEGMFGTAKGIAQIVITYNDGSHTIAGTDDSWSYI